MLQASMNIEVEFALDETPPALTASAAPRGGAGTLGAARHILK